MNRWNLTNVWFQRWQMAIHGMKHCGNASGAACIANMNYVCYLAQEWAGARK